MYIHILFRKNWYVLIIKIYIICCECVNNVPHYSTLFTANVHLFFLPKNNYFLFMMRTLPWNSSHDLQWRGDYKPRHHQRRLKNLLRWVWKMSFIAPWEEAGMLWLKWHNQPFIVNTMSLKAIVEIWLWFFYVPDLGNILYYLNSLFFRIFAIG